MSIIYALAPDDVISKVLHYHSQSGIFGISGLIHMAGADNYLYISNILFYALLLILLAISWNLFWRHRAIGSRETVLYAAILLAAIPSLGPGYGPQYIYWFMPFLVATYAFYTGQWRVVLAGFAVISIFTYLVEYALLPEFGYSLQYMLDPTRAPSLLAPQAPFLFPVAEQLDSETGRTLFRLPVFVAYLTLLACGVRVLLRNVPNLYDIRLSKRILFTSSVALLGLAFGALAVSSLAKPKPENDGKSNAAALPTDRDFAERTKNVLSLNNLAWELATSSNDRIRDGTLAVKVAQRACEQTHFRVPVMIGTLAAAYAEAGRFDDAVSMGQKAYSMASSLGDTNLLKRNQELVTLYQAHQPYHEPPPNSAAIPK